MCISDAPHELGMVRVQGVETLNVLDSLSGEPGRPLQLAHPAESGASNSPDVAQGSAVNDRVVIRRVVAWKARSCCVAHRFLPLLLWASWPRSAPVAQVPLPPRLSPSARRPRGHGWGVA